MSPLGWFFVWLGGCAVAGLVCAYLDGRAGDWGDAPYPVFIAFWPLCLAVLALWWPASRLHALGERHRERARLLAAERAESDAAVEQVLREDL